MHVAIIGPGNMGRALATRFIAGGHQVSLVGKDRAQTEQVVSGLREAAGGSAAVDVADAEQAIERSEVVILALPYQASLEAAGEHGRWMPGKVVIDISNPLNQSYTGLVTGGGPSAAETLRSLLPQDAHVVKAFNTTFARTLMDGVVSGQQLDVFIAGDDEAARERVTELVRGGGMRPIVVGGLERARQLEALGFLGISMQEPLGTGFMTGWKLVFPGTEAPAGPGFPRNAVVGVLADTGAVGEIVTELAAVGVEQSQMQLVMGPEGAEALRNAQQSRTGIVGSLFGYESEHTQRHLREVEAGNVVVVVEVADEAVGERVGQILLRHGARFANYYSRWTARNLSA